MTTPTTAPINGRTPQAIPMAAAVPLPGTERTEIALIEYERIKVKVLSIQFDLLNAHKHLDEYIEQLAANIAERGLINEPLVRLDPKTNLYLLVAGEARVKAMIRLGWKDTYVRCLKGTFTEQQHRDLALIDNLLKEDLDPLAFGLYCQDEMARSGRSARELAKVLSNKVDTSTITRAVALGKKLPQDLHELIRSSKLPPAVARLLTGLKDDDAKRQFAALYTEGKVKSGAELAAAIKAAKDGKATGSTSSFTCQDQESGVKIAVTFPGQDLGPVKAVLRQLGKDLDANGHRGLEKFKDFLSKKARAAQKQAELKAAQDDLAGLTNPTPSIPPPAAGGGKKE